MMKNITQYILAGSLAASMLFFPIMEANMGNEGMNQPFNQNQTWTENSQDCCAPESCCENSCENVQPCCQPACCDTACCRNFRLSARIGGFYPTNHNFRRGFGCVGAIYGLEAAYTFCGCFTGFLDFDYYHKSGRPCCMVEKSTVQLYTGSLGLCWSLKMCSCIEPYIGIGALVGNARFRDRFVDDDVDLLGCARRSKTGFGGIVKAGVIIPFASCWFGELFCDYVYLPLRFERRVNLGGVKFGGGLGISF